jgi:DNA-3-methyladenine glycosylase II
MRIPLTVRAPFDLAQSLTFMRRFAPCRDGFLIEAAAVTTAISIERCAVAFRIEPDPGGASVVVDDGVARSAARRALVVRHAEHLLGAGDELEGFYAAAAGDHDGFRAIVRDLFGLHHVRFLTLAEIAVYAVLMQRSPMTQAARNRRRFAERFGRAITVDGRVLYAIPELDELCALDAADFREAIRHPGKAAALPGVVRGVAAIGEPFLRTAPYDEARRALLAIPGIGPFSAGAILLRGLGRMDDVPLESEPFAAPARRVYGDGWDPRRVRARYGASVGYWSYYLKTGGGAAGRLTG